MNAILSRRQKRDVLFVAATLTQPPVAEETKSLWSLVRTRHPGWCLPCATGTSADVSNIAFAGPCRRIAPGPTLEFAKNRVNAILLAECPADSKGYFARCLQSR
jgi:hypothetical protein